MSRKLWLSAAMFAIGATLLVAASLAGPASGGGSAPASADKAGKRKGGTLRVNLATDTDYVDPQLAYYVVSWQIEYATCAKLLNYPDKKAPEGAQLVPEVATGLPTVSKDGKTYTFTVRTGKDAYRFSNGQVVTAASFAAAINRALNPKMNSPAVSFITDIVGAQAVIDGKAQTASGVTVKGNTLTVKLSKVAPDFLARIAMPFFCAIPTNLPIVPEGVQSLPGAGPYYVDSYTPNRQIVLKRNTRYTHDRPANFDQIVYTVGKSPEASVLEIQNAEADYVADGLPPAAHAELGEKYGLNKTQYWVNPGLIFRYIALNNDRPLFKNNLALRRAVNFAIDRPALLRVRGKYAGKRTDQYLPPGMPGFRNARIYPLQGANVETAKKWVAQSKVKPDQAVLYTCNRGACIPTAQIVQFNLKQIGFGDVEIKSFARAVQFGKTGTRGEPFDLTIEGWAADYADPFDFINVLLDGRNIQETNNVNFSYFNDPAFNKKMEEAARLPIGPKRYETYGKLDADIAWNGSPLAAWQNDNVRDFFSSRIDPQCILYQPVYEMDLAALCLK